MSKKRKFYVVWKGLNPGIYNTWEECKSQVIGFTAAEYKSFDSLEEAEKAFENYDLYKKNEVKKTVYYVVWEGFNPGIYTTWKETEKQIAGYKAPKFKAFGSKQLAEIAFREDPEKYSGRSFKKTKDMSKEEIKKYGYPDLVSICVDAACNKKGDFEYRGVITESGTELFHVGPLQNGSNNVGEFLALVHALAYLKKNRSDLLIYSDSKYAMKWVANKKANSSVNDKKVMYLIDRAEKWLKENNYPNKILKWQTKFWGEIPADFGRK